MHDATFSKEQLLRLKVATCSEMADQAAVEQVQSLRYGGPKGHFLRFQK